MPAIQNNQERGAVGLPDGTVIEAGQTVQVDDKVFKDWTEKHPVVKHWVEKKVLSEAKQAAKS